MIRTIIAGTVALIVLLGGGTAADFATGLQPATGFAKPVTGAVVTQGFGCTSFSFEIPDPACPGGHWHSGVDLAAPRGTPVMATLDGAVSVRTSASGFGLHVVLDHGGGLSSLYGHLDSVAVQDGSVAVRGSVIGRVGSSGNSTGPHLHFEVRRDGVAEDPRADVPLP